MKRIFLAALLMASLGMVAGCGEKPQTVSYEDGRYRGKPDDRVWESTGSQAAWESRIRARSAGQNETNRIGR